MIGMFKKAIVIWMLMSLLSIGNFAYACIVSGGIYYHPLSEVEGSLVDSQNYYRKQLNIDDITVTQDDRIKLTKEYEGGSSVLLKVEVPFEFSNKPIYLNFENILEVETEEQKDAPEFEKKSVFSVGKVRLIQEEGDSFLFVKEQAFSTKYRITKDSLLMKIRAKVIANAWAFSVIVQEPKTKPRTSLSRNYISGNISPCGSRILHVKSLKRAKALDAARSTGFYQYTDKP